jgi:hypothetical protein
MFGKRGRKLSDGQSQSLRRCCASLRRRRAYRPYLERLETRELLDSGAASLAYGQIPLSFEANEGQTDPTVQFLSRGSGYSLFLTSQEAVLSLSKPVAPSAGGTTQAVPVEDVIRMELVGANARAPVVGEEELSGTINYFVGNDPARWRTNVPTYGKVAYQDLYPGIDLVYYGNQRQLEYDFVVGPGADPRVIGLSFRGAENLALDAQGNLVLHTAEGDVLEHAPVIYQDGPGGHQTVSGRYVLVGKDQVGFQTGFYDESRPLIIDPVLSYSTYLGGSNGDFGSDIAVDGSGNAYLAGYTGSFDFPTTPGAVQRTLAGNTNVFVAKLNSTGTALIYSTYLGGNSVGGGYASGAWGIAVDSLGDAYVTGGTIAANFPTTPSALQRNNSGGLDIFVTKLNSTGTALLYSTYLGGSGDDRGFGIAVDGVGNAYLTGWTQSYDFPTTPGSLQRTFSGLPGIDCFVAKLNATGSGLLYSTYLGSGGSTLGRHIALDASGNAYITGETDSPRFPTTPAAVQTTYGGSGLDDAFVTELNAVGSALVYSTYLGGSGTDQGVGIAVDASGNAYVTGYTDSSNFPTTPGAIQTAYGGKGDAFVAKLNATGTALIYSTYLGGTGSEGGAGIAVDASGNAYVTGGTTSPDFPTTPGAASTINGNADAFLAKLNATGTTLIYSTYFGGSGNENGYAIAVDASGNAYVTGETDSSNFPTTPGAPQMNYGGNGNAFVTKIALPQDSLLVTNTLDGGPGSLRDVLTAAPPRSTVHFLVGLHGTILLTTGPLPIAKNVTITGPGADVITVSGNHLFQVFTISSAVTATISGMTIANGTSALFGGGAFNDGMLTLANCAVSGNSSGNRGGGIYNSPSGIMLVSNCTVSGNSTANAGNGIYNYGTLTVSGSAFSGNSSNGADGGAIFSLGTVSISNSTFFGNGGPGAYGGALRNDGNMTISGSTFTGNVADTGGAIYNIRTLMVSNSGFSANTTNPPFTQGRGGGAIFNSATLTIDNSAFSGNVGDYGGGILNDGTLLARRSTFSQNFGLYDGGAILDEGGTSTIQSCSFSGNAAESTGAIHSDGPLTISDSTLSGNSDGLAAFGASAVWANQLTMSNCTILGNRAQEQVTIFIGAGTISSCAISGNRTGSGVATILVGGTVTISDCTITGNNGLEAGAIFNNGALTLDACTISGNQALIAGGISNHGTLIVSNCTMSGNNGYGPVLAVGAIANLDTVMVLNSTIANNTSLRDAAIGGQLYSGPFGQTNYGSIFQLRNTIVSGDGSSPNFVTGANGKFVSLGHNLSSDDASGFLTGPGDLISRDPLLGPLQDNGGPILTMALLSGSPAIDAGDNADAPAFDQRGPGFPRIVAGVIDIGAFEVQSTLATRFQISAPAQVTSGTPFDVTVTALDPYGVTAAGYLGTVTFSSTDPFPGVVLPSAYTFKVREGGVHTFVGLVLLSPAYQILTVTDTIGVTGGAVILVTAPAPPGAGGTPDKKREHVGMTPDARPDNSSPTCSPNDCGFITDYAAERLDQQRARNVLFATYHGSVRKATSAIRKEVMIARLGAQERFQGVEALGTQGEDP